MLKISHEVPLQLLEASRKFNSYDYALVHLFEKYPEYKQFYRDSVALGREVLLDNSAFELGSSVDNSVLLKGIQDVHPTYVVAPDVVGNFYATLKRTLNFMSELPKEDSPEVIGVIQGSSFADYIRCYREYIEIGINYIAIPYDIKCFEVFPKIVAPTKAMHYALARWQLIQQLLAAGTIKSSVKHHLLGASDPIEFLLYKDPQYKFITSVDTSCPIILGMFGETLPEDGGGIQREKRPEKLAENLEKILTTEQVRLIYKNVETYRKHYVEGVGN